MRTLRCFCLYVLNIIFYSIVDSDQSTAWESLLAEELAVSKSTEGNLKTQQLSILELLRSDRIEKQNSALKEEFMQLLHEEGVYDLDGLENSNSGGDESKLDNGELLLGMEILMLQWYQRIGGVDKAYKEQCRIINLEKATLSAKLRGKSAVDKNVDEEYGFESSEGLNCSSQKSWTQEEIELFAKEYRRWQVSGSGRKLLMTMLQSQLPSKSYDEIVEHESCFRQFQALGVKQREEQTSYEQQRIDLLRQAKEAVKQHVKAYKEAKEKETTLKELEMRREVMHRKLEHLRRIREQEAMILQQEERKRIEKEQQQSDLAKEMALLEQQERKSLVEAYHRQKQEEQAQRAAEEEKRHEELQEEILRMIEENRPKVELRAQLEREKKDKQRQKEVCIPAI